jgi:hypothetical protein
MAIGTILLSYMHRQVGSRSVYGDTLSTPSEIDEEK